MDTTALVAGGLAMALTAIHAGTAALTAVRQRQRKAGPVDIPKISIVRPLKGIEPFSYATLKSTFDLQPAAAEIIFCVEYATDPIVPIVERLIAEHPEVAAKLLVGRDIISGNPKLNNLAKGWHAAVHDWIAFIDSNVLLPPDALARLVVIGRA